MPRCLVTILCFCIHLTASAQVRLTFNDGRTLMADRWTINEGLPLDTVYAINQTDDGFLWLCVDDGLTRFDGLAFKTWSIEDGLSDNSLQALSVAQDGKLWVGSYDGGVNIMADGGISRIRQADGLLSDRIWSIDHSSDGSVWIATNEGVSFGQIGRPWSHLTTEHGLPANWVRVVFVDADNRVWIGTEGAGICVWNGTHLQLLNGPEFPKDVSVVAIHQDINGVIWMGTRDHGLWRVDKDALVRVPLSGRDARWVRALASDKNGTLWVGTMAHGLATLIGDKVEWLADVGLKIVDVLSLFVSQQDTVWVGTGGDGLVQIRPPQVKVVDDADGLHDSWVFVVTEDTKGVLWASTKSGLYRILRGRAEPVRFDDDGVWTYSLLPENDHMWLGTAGKGLKKIDSSGQLNISIPRIGDRWVYALAHDKQGQLLIGSDRGLAVYDRQNVRYYTESDGLPPCDVLNILLADSRVWLGTDKGLYSFDGQRCEKIELPFEEQPVVLSLAQHESLVLIGTDERGLLILDDEGAVSRYSQRNGLFQNTVYQLLVTDNRVWISSPRGIQAIDSALLVGLHQDGGGQLEGSLFDQRDGMPSRECNGGTMPAGTIARDGSVWFPTIRGLVGIRPDQLNDHRPKSYITKVLANNESLAFDQNFVVPAGTERLEIHFSALALTMPGRTQFRYRLGNRWVHTMDRQVIFSHLAPGNYQFEVAASNGSGQWDTSRGRALITFSVSGYWLRSLKLWALLFVAVVFVLYRLYWRRPVELVMADEGAFTALKSVSQRALSSDLVEELARKLRDLRNEVSIHGDQGDDAPAWRETQRKIDYLLEFIGTPTRQKQFKVTCDPDLRSLFRLLLRREIEPQLVPVPDLDIPWVTLSAGLIDLFADIDRNAINNSIHFDSRGHEIVLKAKVHGSNDQVLTITRNRVSAAWAPFRGRLSYQQKGNAIIWLLEIPIRPSFGEVAKKL